ncbi:cytochrome C oxidase subunit IV family protein [Pedobacter puniceum]|jgi:caa(3)-type oxidase subunit IV|uniref:Caa(3)-type oxidase n=1 Tax=Pedobacter puniceum TaxID=2666136 RepID=A0A7K0FNZ5_9SPHI|nr:cytochrome C oxidase subunit IV family protein [Pedobacter puniceum]MRX47135.1 caa(3)-type oxidase [Pedobacter puniceum]
MSQENTHLEHAEEHASMSKGKIWKVFFILLFITVIEFIIALAIPETVMSHGVKNFLYIALTLLKAYYIVAFFMHLKFEKYALIVAILVSFVFIIYFIILMLTEGNYIQDSMPI